MRESTQYTHIGVSFFRSGFKFIRSRINEIKKRPKTVRRGLNLRMYECTHPTLMQIFESFLFVLSFQFKTLCWDCWLNWTHDNSVENTPIFDLFFYGEHIIFQIAIKGVNFISAVNEPSDANSFTHEFSLDFAKALHAWTEFETKTVVHYCE